MTQPNAADADLDGRHDFDLLFGDWLISNRKVRDITASSARWTQAFSFDGGRTFVPNWVMEFRRPPG